MAGLQERACPSGRMEKTYPMHHGDHAVHRAFRWPRHRHMDSQIQDFGARENRSGGETRWRVWCGSLAGHCSGMAVRSSKVWQGTGARLEAMKLAEAEKGNGPA